jgi:hypothetical protein
MAKTLYIQSGKNDKYPQKIEIWKYGEQPIPEWITDICKVSFIDGNGNITLEYRETSTGGVEFISTAEGNKTAFTIKSKNDIVCWGDSRLFVLRPIQFELLYKKEK